MDEQNLPFGDGQPDFLSMINAEVDKIRLIAKDTTAPLTKPSQPVFVSHEPMLLLPSPSMIEAKQLNTSEKVHHLKAETFTELLIPIDWLSVPVQTYIRTVAEAFGCPRDYVTAICFITAGIAAGKKVKLVTNPYTNYPSDYLCIVGKPSRNKTGPIQEVTRPLRERDKANFIEYTQKKNEYDHNKQEDKYFSGDKPMFHQHVAGDSSPESRNSLLAQGDLLLISADELKSFIDSFGRYAKGGNGSGTEVSQLLSIWSNVSFTINRKSEETKLVDDPAMSIVGGIQPNPLGRTFSTDALMDSGFTQRFLFVYPDKAKFIKRRDRTRMAQEMRGCWSSIIGNLFNMPPLTLQLSHEAEWLYADYADANDMKADAEGDDYIGGVKQKMNIHVLRMVIMIHLLSDNWYDSIITGKEMDFAIRVADYFTRIHIERIYPLLSSNNQQVQKKLTKELVITEIGQAFPDIKNKSALAEALGYDRAKLTNIINGKFKR